MLEQISILCAPQLVSEALELVVEGNRKECVAFQIGVPYNTLRTWINN